MFITASEAEAKTLTRLIKAMDAQHPVTISYLKEEKDAAGKKTGNLVETVRTIETYDIRVTKAGDTLLIAMDRESQERRTFRLDRLVAYTVHRTAYTVPRETTTTAPVSHGLRAAALVLAPHPLAPAVSPEQRVTVLAGFLAAA